MEMYGEPGMQHPPKGPSVGTVVFIAILFGLIAGFGGTLLALTAINRGYVSLPTTRYETSSTPDGTHRASGSASATSPHNFSQVADDLDDSVVNINTLSRQQNPYSFFFGGGSQVVKGLGTGVIVDKDGYILTNYHVVGEAENIKVTVLRGDTKQEYTAELIGGDKQEDLALIKINAPNLRPVKFGDSDKLRPGEWVMAIGNPFGFEHTVSVGVVSALNRRLPVDDAVTLRGMIQTDASINPGNSGGPLVNLDGQVVGIDTAIYTGGGAGQPQARGLGFAIPSSHAVKILNQLRNHRKVQHPYIGIKYEMITDEVRQTEKLPVRDGGVIVRGIYKDGPCGKAGVKKDDIIVSVDGKLLNDSSTMSDYINQQDVGKVLEMKVKRWNGMQWNDLTLHVRVDDMPKDYLRAMTEQQQRQPSLTPSPDSDGGEGDNTPGQTPNDGNGGGHSSPSFPFPFPF